MWEALISVPALQLASFTKNTANHEVVAICQLDNACKARFQVHSSLGSAARTASAAKFIQPLNSFSHSKWQFYKSKLLLTGFFSAVTNFLIIIDSM